MMAEYELCVGGKVYKGTIEPLPKPKKEKE